MVMVGLRIKSYYQKIRGYIFWGEFVFVCTHIHACDDDDDADHEQQQNWNSSAVVMTAIGSNNIRATKVGP